MSKNIVHQTTIDIRNEVSDVLEILYDIREKISDNDYVKLCNHIKVIGDIEEDRIRYDIFRQKVLLDTFLEIFNMMKEDPKKSYATRKFIKKMDKIVKSDINNKILKFSIENINQLRKYFHFIQDTFILDMLETYCQSTIK
jgi:hypothetical protein